jgi:hypothetical protein
MFWCFDERKWLSFRRWESKAQQVILFFEHPWNSADYGDNLRLLACRKAILMSSMHEMIPDSISQHCILADTTYHQAKLLQIDKWPSSQNWSVHGGLCAFFKRT